MHEPAQASPQVSTLLYQLFAEEWEFRMQEDPISATFSGDYRFNDRLPAIGEADFQRRAEQTRQFFERLQRLDRQVISEADQLNYDIFERQLRERLAEHEHKTFLVPLAKLSGPHSYLPDLVEVTPFRTADDYRAYLTRLQGMGAFLKAHIDLMKRGMQSGYVPAIDAMQGIQDSLRAHLVDDPEESAFYQPFRRSPAGVAEAEVRRLAQAGKQAIRESVLPGFATLLEFIEGEYLPACRAEPGVSALPGGKAYYEYCVWRYTTLSISPQEVHQTGVREVARIRAEMDEVMRSTGFSGDFHSFLEYLRNEPRFYVTTPEALLKEAAYILKRMDGELPRLFKTLPRTPYGIRETPDYIAPRSTTAYYFPPAGDLSTAGFYYVNTYDLKSRPLYEYEALSFHEAVPGHHLQLSLQFEGQDVPLFRRFGDVTAFIEGWALYSERLGLEVGFYTDPYSNFGRLTFEMWRACRLVVDTGLHALGWTRQQAIDYMAENTSLAMLNIINEVDRYIAWPGQALAYKMGELKIRELRRLAEETLGAGFDVRQFHEVLLESGGIPLEVLGARVQAWLADTA